MTPTQAVSRTLRLLTIGAALDCWTAVAQTTPTFQATLAGDEAFFDYADFGADGQPVGEPVFLIGCSNTLRTGTDVRLDGVTVEIVE